MAQIATAPKPYPLSEALPLLYRLDWKDHAFVREKAYVAALFSELAYWHIPEFELEDHDRIKVVPCYAYQALARGGNPAPAVDALLATLEVARPIMIARRFIVVLIIPTPQVLFVAIRGTKFLYDWAINLNARKHPFRDDDDEYRRLFHRGFLRALVACLSPLMAEVEKLSSPNTPVYVTGHSLGGALAAILHAIANRYWDHHRLEPRCTHSAYTFGMPRYGNTAVMLDYLDPYHVYSKDDIVPSVPPRWLGFADSLEEYRTTGLGVERSISRETWAFAKWMFYLVSGIGIRSHFMERYREAVKP